MPALPLVMFPDKRLITKTEPVIEFNEELNTLISNMIETILENNLVGLSANQVGVNKSVFVIIVQVENQAPNETKFMAFVNPVLKVDRNSGEKWGWEGCGSIANTICLVKRWGTVTVTAQNAKGEEFEYTADGTSAIVLQHEYSHLQGKLIMFMARQTKRSK